MNLSKQQVQQIIQNAPPGSNPREVVKGLVARGYQLEGLNDIQAPQEPEHKSVGGFFGNVLKSGGEFIKNTANAVIHPIQTAKGLGGIAVGAAEKLVPGQQGAEQNFNALTDFFKQRYGSIDALKETAYNDPVGFASDLSAVLGLGAGAVSGVSKLAGFAEAGNVASKAGTVSNVLSKASEVTNPLIAPGKAISALAPKGATSSLAQSIYERALKPSSKLSQEERANIVLTGLKEGVPISKSGLTQLDNHIDDLNGQISRIIKKGAENGDRVAVSDVAAYTRQLRDFADHSLAPNHYTKLIDDIEQEFLNHPKSVDGYLPVDVAQKIKQNTYQILRKSYGEMKGMEVETSKALARGIKEEITKQIPELKGINAHESELLAFEKELEKAVGRITKQDVIDLGTEGAAVAGTVVGGPGGGLLAGLTQKILTQPGIRSRIAILLQKVADRTPRQAGVVRKAVLPTARIQAASQQRRNPR